MTKTSTSPAYTISCGYCGKDCGGKCGGENDPKNAFVAVPVPEYTAGPWTFEKDVDGLFVIVADDRNPASILGDPDDSEVEANARLIAAAPELLDQCKILSAALAECYDWKEMEGEKIPEEFTKADAVIAKAEGRA